MGGHVGRDRVEYAALAVCRLLRQEGVEGLTMRAIAADVGCSPSTLVHRFGSRRSMLVHVAAYIGELWLEGLYGWTRDLASLLPADDMGLWHTRCWLAMEELARTDPDLSAVVVDVRTRERRLVARHAGDLDAPALAHLQAVLDGLRAQMTSPAHGLSIDAARAVLATHAAGHPADDRTDGAVR